MPRIDRGDLYMEMASLVARRGTCPRKQVGAVIVRNNRVISMGYNGAPPGMPHCTEVGCGQELLTQSHETDHPTWSGCMRATHAELNAVVFSARQGIPTDAAAMYATCSTCVTCAMTLVTAGIVRFVYDEEYRIKDGLELLESANVEVYKWNR